MPHKSGSERKVARAAADDLVGGRVPAAVAAHLRGGGRFTAGWYPFVRSSKGRPWALSISGRAPCRQEREEGDPVASLDRSDLNQDSVPSKLDVAGSSPVSRS